MTVTVTQFHLPRMARTVLSFRTSIDPEQTKYIAWRASPWRMRNSPGAQKEVLMMSDRDRRQPLLADSNSGSCSSSLFKCMAMSALSSSGKSFSSWGEIQEKITTTWATPKSLRCFKRRLLFLLRSLTITVWEGGSNWQNWTFHLPTYSQPIHASSKRLRSVSANLQESQTCRWMPTKTRIEKDQIFKLFCCFILPHNNASTHKADFYIKLR